MALIKFILDLEDRLEGRFPEIEKLIERLKSEIDNLPTQSEIIRALQSYVTELIQDSIPEVKDGHTPTDTELLALIRPLIPKVEDGKDGHTPTEEELLAIIKPLIPELEPLEIPDETPQSLRDKLETLKDDDRLDKSAIKGIKEIEDSISNIPRGGGRAGWGSHPLQIRDEGTVVDKVARFIDFVGSGVSVTRSADGINTVTITDTGSITPVAVTGTYNATQTSGHILLNCDASGGNVTINLPTAVGNSALFQVHKNDSSDNTVTVDPATTEQIKGDNTLTINFQFSTAAIVSNGAGWVLV